MILEISEIKCFVTTRYPNLIMSIIYQGTNHFRTNASQQNSEFLLGLLLEENKHIQPMDFILKGDKVSDYCCICVTMAVAEQYEAVRDSFMSSENFIATYFPLYASALEQYRSIVGQDLRTILVDEAKIFYPIKLETMTFSHLISNHDNRNTVINLLENAKNDHSYIIILRDEIAFVVIHYENDNFIVIDPHVDCCGILSKTGVYRYIVYDVIWDFQVDLMIPEKPKNIPIENVPAENLDTSQLIQTE